MSDEVARKRMERLIERSSLGTPAARAARASVSDDEVARVMARVEELAAAEEGSGLPPR